MGCGLALERGTNEALLRPSAREFAFSQIPLAVILCKKLSFSNLSRRTDGRLGVRFSPDSSGYPTGLGGLRTVG